MADLSADSCAIDGYLESLILRMQGMLISMYRSMLSAEHEVL